MIYSDLHMHTHYCDGKNSPKEMVLSAIEKGLKTVGICAHAPMPFRADWCIREKNIKEFIDEIKDLKEKYRGKINVLCGLEDDVYAVCDRSQFDYVIGSVHFFKVGEKYYPIDLSDKDLRLAVEEGFKGDAYAAAEQYFENVVKVVKDATVVGHFDLITKFKDKDKLFDENCSRYKKAWMAAVDKIIPLNIPFEINTGAISRGHRTTPYPSFEMIEYIKEKGGKLVISSDSHNAQNVAFEFDKWKDLV
ncbi:MAG: histidinol-phosphatase [Clostridia bacterium]|nr:histidinol-phosphatase [Clostridia bacterium]